MLATDALLEKSAGLALGCVVAACGAGAVPAAFAGAAVAGAGLAGLLHKTFSAKGLDSKAAIAAVRRRTRDRLAREAVRSITPSDVHLIEAADRALALHLDSCFPNRDALVEHTFDPDGFPTRVSALVLKELEARSPEFFSDRAPTFAVSFARTVVESSLRAALETPEYFALLQPHLVTALHQRIARIERTLAEGLRINAEADAKTHELLHAMMARLDASGAMVQAQAQGLSEKQITALLTRFGHLGVPLEQAERLLLKAADELTELRARLSTLRNDEPEVSVKRAAAVAAMDASDFATADELLAEAEALDLASGEMRILRAAEIRSQRADLARSQLRLLDAADHYAEAARLAAPFDLMEARSAAWSEAMTCREHAELFGGTNSIDRAVGVLRRELDGLNFGAMVLVADSIATLLMMRSDRSGDAGVAEIRGAVDLYVKIYSQFQAGEFPDLQQRVLCGLGVAQHKLGRRLLFRDGLPILQQSAETFRLAIRIMDAHKNWEHRRTALSGLGSVLTTLGEKLEPATSLPILVESLSVLGANAASIDRIIEPNAWASAVGRLGVAEMSLGSKTSGPQGLSLLLSAARCHEEALGVLQRDSQAANWALAQFHLGASLHNIAERVSVELRAPYLTAAASAYERSLEVQTREDWPDDWARTQNNLGGLYLRLTGCSGSELSLSLLSKSVLAFKAALTVYGEDSWPSKWVVTQLNLGRVLVPLGRELGASGGLDFMREAACCFKSVLNAADKVTIKERSGLIGELAELLLFIGDQIGGVLGNEYLDEARRLAEADR